MESIPANFKTSFDGRPRELDDKRTSESAVESTAPLEERPPTRLSESLREEKAKSEEALAEALDLPTPPNSAVTFRVSQETDRFFIQVVDKNTGEVLRQIPSDEMLRLAESISQIRGSLLNTSA